MNKILKLIGREKELFVEDINRHNDELKNIVPVSFFFGDRWSGFNWSGSRKKDV